MIGGALLFILGKGGGKDTPGVKFLDGVFKKCVFG